MLFLMGRLTDFGLLRMTVPSVCSFSCVMIKRDSPRRRIQVSPECSSWKETRSSRRETIVDGICNSGTHKSKSNISTCRIDVSPRERSRTSAIEVLIRLKECVNWSCCLVCNMGFSLRFIGCLSCLMALFASWIRLDRRKDSLSMSLCSSRTYILAFSWSILF